MYVYLDSVDGPSNKLPRRAEISENPFIFAELDNDSCDAY